MIVTTVCHSAWDNAYKMRLAMEWFRLYRGRDPRTLFFSIPAVQQQWEECISDFEAAVHSGSHHGGDDAATLLGRFLRIEVDALRQKRETLDEIP